MDELYQETTTFGECDFTSYSYLLLSVLLSTFGSFITVVALGGTDDYIFAQLGHMWLVGPLFICSGLMMGIKTVLYLRKKSVIQMLLRQRALLRSLQEMAHHSHSQSGSNVTRNASTLTLPPSYDLLMTSDVGCLTGESSEAPPPSYEEAMFLIDEKWKNVLGEPNRHTSHSLDNFVGTRSKENE